jgi:exodeoxyribonuclease VII large subunit
MALRDGLTNEPNSERALTVSELTDRIKETLESAFPSIWVSGEISNLSRPHSGHIYLTLKDEAAQIRGVIWRGAAAGLRFDLQDGLEVICRGDIDVYPPRGSYQLVIRQIEPKGVGALQLAFRQLHARLAAEGLFDAQHKKPLPRFPRRIAFVTSPTGAAIRDFLEVVRRRWRGIHVLVIPARVQGEGAAADIVAGIKTANLLADPPDVLIVGRGGGSLEDLWCFNEESVVRAIFASRVPVVSAVGHEIDVTLSDLVADVRALTPSEAAERVVPSGDEVLASLNTIGQRLTTALRSRAATARSRIDAIAQRRVFRRPFDRLHELSRRVDELELRASRAMQNRLTRASDRLAALSGRLDSLSPLAVLGRGYSVTHRTRDGQLVRDASTLTIGEQITSRLAKGQLVSRVEEVLAEPSRAASSDTGSEHHRG